MDTTDPRMASAYPAGACTAAADADAATRRAKKRELDRRAQRAARERNRNRIAYLEAVVDAMSHQESSFKIASLIQQLNDMTRQRDSLAGTLSSIETVMQTHREGKRSGEPPTDQPLHPPEPLSISTIGPDWASDSHAVDAIGIPADEAVFTPDTTWDLPEFEGGGAPTLALAPDISPDTSYRSADQTALGPLGEPAPGPSPTRDPIQPYPDAICDCVALREQPDTPGPPSRSIWRSANEALSGRELLSKNALCFEDAMSDDIPVRVILEGWDSVERSGKLPPLWRKLRRTDELQFSGCSGIERLAILKLMHCLLRYQAEPTVEQCAKLPPWYLSRPSQAIPHSSAIDFFVWPGVRERFIFSQHRYCSNLFWKVFASGFHIRWPFEFRDCYKRNVQTNQFSIAPEFERCIRDINSWTMSADFFGHFPEMYADIPAFQEVPRLSIAGGHHQGHAHGRIAADDVEDVDRDMSEMDFLNLATYQDWAHPSPARSFTTAMLR